MVSMVDEAENNKDNNMQGVRFRWIAIIHTNEKKCIMILIEQTSNLKRFGMYLFQNFSR